MRRERRLLDSVRPFSLLGTFTFPHFSRKVRRRSLIHGMPPQGRGRVRGRHAYVAPGNSGPWGAATARPTGPGATEHQRVTSRGGADQTDMRTGALAMTTGIYRSGCACRAHVELPRAAPAPACPRCERRVDWVFERSTFLGSGPDLTHRPPPPQDLR
jgi:hypothetical protein